LNGRHCVMGVRSPGTVKVRGDARRAFRCYVETNWLSRRFSVFQNNHWRSRSGSLIS
jgi:hypothetical protein